MKKYGLGLVVEGFVMVIEVRKMQFEDIDEVLNLCREIREFHIKILDGHFAKQDDELERKMLLETLESEDKIAFVAVYERKIKGVLLAEKKISPWLLCPKTAHIFNFGVCGKSQGQGIAKLLMDVFVQECKYENIEEIKLGVFNKNIGAYKFYEKCGFEPQEQKMRFKIK